jgi:hypothetical protein
VDLNGLGLWTVRNKEFIQNFDMKTTLKMVTWKTDMECEDEIKADIWEVSYDGM